MATVSAKIFEHHKKADGTYNVKIRVYHKRDRKYIDTTHYVVKKQLTKDLKIKDPFIADIVEQQLRKYRNTISDLEAKLDYFSAESLRDFLRDMDEEVDFVKFCDDHIKPTAGPVDAYTSIPRVCASAFSAAPCRSSSCWHIEDCLSGCAQNQIVHQTMSRPTA